MAEPASLQQIADLLAQGLVTEWTQRAYSSEAVIAVLNRLDEIPIDDLLGRLRVAGLTDHPFVAPEDKDGIEQSCATCMYFARHNGLCDLVELMLPVRPEWSCVLWRI